MAQSISKPIEAEKQAEVEFLVEPQPVYLPVCPQCGHVGKRPGASSVTYACTGGMDAWHKRVRMVMVRFEPTPEALRQ